MTVYKPSVSGRCRMHFDRDAAIPQHRLPYALAFLVLVWCRRDRSGGRRPAARGCTARCRLVLETVAQGVQIYTCEKAGRPLSLAFNAPDAALFDVFGRQVGIHFAGPSWQLQDASKIAGEVVAQAPAPEPHALPGCCCGPSRMRQTVC